MSNRDQFSVEIDGWSHGDPIPAKFAFGKPGNDGPFATSDNLSPAIRWSNPPVGTRSFAIICHDPDVPSVGDDVNLQGKTVPADLPRVPFFHWVLVDIPVGVSAMDQGAAADGVTARGKAVGRTAHGVAGANDYTGWFAGDPDMEGTYGGYDGPCPPWNDSIVHHYHFTVYALDVPSLGLQDGFTGPDALAAIEGHVLASASYMGTYSMNPAVPA
ncbi:MAG: YbhB/YbcL family Raf kinase inhibitor-like protein [Deltaproteobacteria bacterium]|nr:YbhB/YbcL family Raf kinase inhibitor-like protein [Deltaproteobacteria bacterium]